MRAIVEGINNMLIHIDQDSYEAFLKSITRRTCPYSAVTIACSLSMRQDAQAYMQNDNTVGFVMRACVSSSNPIAQDRILKPLLVAILSSHSGDSKCTLINEFFGIILSPGPLYNAGQTSAAFIAFATVWPKETWHKLTQEMDLSFSLSYQQNSEASEFLAMAACELLSCGVPRPNSSEMYITRNLDQRYAI